jgi:DNA adenine methylase
MTQARPFLKWVGGKRAVVPELLKHVPARYNTYREPFVGGGALFFALRPARAVLSDLNETLVKTYRAVRDSPAELCDLLRAGATQYEQYGADFYYHVRKFDLAANDVTTAAWMIFLNKTGFNGIYRVNKSGQFNVPHGRHKNLTICDEPNIRACSEALRGAEIRHADFRAVESEAAPGDLVYFDPPYVPLTDTADFTSYTKEGFGPRDQLDLRDVAWRLKQRGVYVILSNSSGAGVAELYAEKGFTLREIDVRRSINSDTSARGPVKEYVIT